MAAPWAVGDHARVPRGSPQGLPPGLASSARSPPGLGPSHSLPNLKPAAALRGAGGPAVRGRRGGRASAAAAAAVAGGQRSAAKQSNRRLRRHQKLAADVPPLQLPAGRSYLSLPDVLDRAKEIRQNWKLPQHQRAEPQQQQLPAGAQPLQQQPPQQQRQPEAAAAAAVRRPDLLEEVAHTRSLLAAVQTEPASLAAYREHFRQYDDPAGPYDGAPAPREDRLVASTAEPQWQRGNTRPDEDEVLATKLRLRKLSRCAALYSAFPVLHRCVSDRWRNPFRSKQLRLLELEEMLGDLHTNATSIMQRVHEVRFAPFP